jgi:hypothetical protein
MREPRPHITRRAEAKAASTSGAGLKRIMCTSTSGHVAVMLLAIDARWRMGTPYGILVRRKHRPEAGPTIPTIRVH